MSFSWSNESTMVMVSIILPPIVLLVCVVIWWAKDEYKYWKRRNKE